jgi:hypothetical protein
MERRHFIKESLLAGMALAQPGFPVYAGKEESSFLKVVRDPNFPQLSFFSVDSLGKDQLRKNVISKEDANNSCTGWKLTSAQKTFSLTTEFEEGCSQPFVIKINQHVNHATFLGRIGGVNGEIKLPGIMHLPDMGTFRVTCNVPYQKVLVDAKRFIDEPFVRIRFPAATADAIQKIYSFEVVTIYPDADDIVDARYDCFKKNFISIFQLNPFLRKLANNSASDACAFTLYKYSEVALYTPPLAEGLTALDLIRETLERYLSGDKGYGLLGYDYDKTWDIPKSPSSCNSLDSYPSLIIAACNYFKGSGDKEWFGNNYAVIKEWSKEMLDCDSDGDGLLEFCLSGDSGSWKGDKSMRPANWWDTIGFGHKDAYSNALAYRALVLLEEVNTALGKTEEAAFFHSKAAQLKRIYSSTFYNPDTGVLAGWKSADGMLHDYYFTFVSGVAICYDLLELSLANDIMDKLLSKMKQVGFVNFELGLPGNLIPVIRADYTDLLPEVGGGKRADNADGFQIYENGGATACFTYFTIHALQKLGRKRDADAILMPLLKSMSEGNFQGRCANGRSKDWKTWSGECWGYEGFLVDNYMFLLTLVRH